MDSLYKKFITDKFRLNRTDVYGLVYGLQHRLSDLCFPRNCIHFGQPAGPPPYQYLCGSCAESLILAHPPNCQGCGFPYPSGSHQPKVCPHCAHLRPAYARAHCLCLAKKTGRQIIHQLKYARGLYLFADLKYIISQRRDLKTICAEALKESLCADLRIEKLLIRTRYTRSQTELNKVERVINVERAFALAPRQKLEFDKKYILIDDVFTTGATANACAQILRKAGVSSIELITFGHG